MYVHGIKYWVEFSKRNIEIALRSDKKRERDVASRFLQRYPEGYTILGIPGEYRGMVFGFLLPFAYQKKHLEVNDCLIPFR